MQMKSVLVFNDLWGYVHGSIPRPTGESEDAQWKARDEKALALIILSVSKNKLGHLRRVTTSKEAWDEINRVHSSQEPVKKAMLYRQLYNSRKNETQTMMQYINDFQNKVNLLEDTGIEIPEELKTIMLLNGLPDTFENFCIAIESRDQIPGVDFIKGKLLEEEARRGDGDDSACRNSASALLSRGMCEKGNRGYKKGKSAITTKNLSDDTSTKERKPNSHRFNGRCF